jgi:inositol oxygenase
MAPGIIADEPAIATGGATPPWFDTPRNGQALEATSDDVDAVNVLKGTLKSLSNVSIQTDEEQDISNNQPLSKDKSQFRQYTTACTRVQNFYALQHAQQTVSYNLWARSQFQSQARAHLTIWEAILKLNTLIDDSDPDTELSQIEHLLQTAEAIRRDGKPRWMQLTGLIHDLGKLLYFFGAKGQWDVVGDTFPVGCAFSPSIILHESFALNADSKDPIYSTEYGIYYPGCGIENIMLSWGHDEYLYQVVKDQSSLPAEALAMIRFHSFYPWHREGAYMWMMKEGDQKLLDAVRDFNQYDLYSKADERPVVEELKDYYIELIDEFFGKDTKLRW